MSTMRILLVLIWYILVTKSPWYTVSLLRMGPLNYGLYAFLYVSLSIPDGPTFGDQNMSLFQSVVRSHSLQILALCYIHWKSNRPHVEWFWVTSILLVYIVNHSPEMWKFTQSCIMLFLILEIVSQTRLHIWLTFKFFSKLCLKRDYIFDSL